MHRSAELWARFGALLGVAQVVILVVTVLLVLCILVSVVSGGSRRPGTPTPTPRPAAAQVDSRGAL